MGLPRVADTPGADITRGDTSRGNRSARIVFIPWPEGIAQEWKEKTEQWNALWKQKSGTDEERFNIVYYKKGRKQDILKALSDPANQALNRDSVVYIRGHGNPGQQYIQVKLYRAGHGGTMVEDGRTDELHIEKACQRLIASGLKKSYQGVIKFYHCHSATVHTPEAFERAELSLTDRTRRWADVQKIKGVSREEKKYFQAKLKSFKKGERDVSLKSLARIGADYMRKKGFGNCIFYGYLGPAGATYVDDPGDHFFGHKSTALDGLEQADELFQLAHGGSVRSSQARIRV